MTTVLQPCDNGVMHALNSHLNELLYISEQLTCHAQHDSERLTILLKALVSFANDANTKKVSLYVC